MEAYFNPLVGGDGSTVSDGTDPNTGLANGGHRTRFVPALAQLVAISAFVVQKAADAAAAAASALGGLGSIATSTTTLTVGAGTKSLNVGTGKTFAHGQKVGVARTSAPTTTAMYGTVTGYSGSTLDVEIAAGDFIGTGSHSDWTVSPTLYGPPASRTITGTGLATGGGDLSANRTINVATASASAIWTGTSLEAVTPQKMSEAAVPQTLTYGATVNWNANSGYNAYLVLGGSNPVMAAPTNLKDGWTYTLFLAQDGTGNRLIASGDWNAIYDWGAVGAPTLSTGASKVDMAFGIYSATTGKLHMSFRKAA